MVRKKFHLSPQLTSGFEETVIAAQNYYGSLRVEVIPIKKIELDEDNPRNMTLQLHDLPAGPQKDDPEFEQKSIDYESLQSIATSIRREGLLNPIIVYKSGNIYKLVAGERRTLASRIAGKEEIQAKILDGKPSPLELSTLQWFENIERKDLTLWERIINLQKIIANYKSAQKSGSISPKELSELLGCSLPLANNYCGVLESGESLLDAIKNNKVQNLEKAAVIARITNLALREKVLIACTNNATLAEMRQIISSESKIKEAQKKVDGKKGRQAIRVNLGVTKSIPTARSIIEAILQVDKYKKLHVLLHDIDWNDYASITKKFQSLVNAVEKEG